MPRWIPAKRSWRRAGPLGTAFVYAVLIALGAGLGAIVGAFGPVLLDDDPYARDGGMEQIMHEPAAAARSRAREGALGGAVMGLLIGLMTPPGIQREA